MPGVPAVRRIPLVCAVAACLVLAGVFVDMPKAAELSDTIKRVKPSIVGVGTYQKTRRPPAVLRGTGFVVADGRHIVTNAHVLPQTLDERNKEFLAVFVGRGKNISVRRVERVAADADHDVAIVRLPDSRLPALPLGDDGGVEEGQAIAFTGFPIGSILGLFPVTHRGIVSSVTPIAIPQASQRQLDAAMIRRLRDNFRVFQLDATAYPGNSGSPVFDPGTGAVYAIVSSVFVKESKEKVLQDPSGITYAIPVRYVRALLKQLGLHK